jgi:gamma-glutamyltranspeptidase/glutathione hydrolase
VARRGSLGLLSLVALSLLAIAPPPEQGPSLVAADHPLASRAGADVLAAGGNAVDAAVAAALSAGVVQPAGSGLGGGGFAVVHRAGAPDTTLDFREVAPRSASRDMFVRDGVPDATGAQDGGTAVAVPGEPRGLAELVRRFGRLPLPAVAAPAIEQAEDGFVVGAHLASAIARTNYAAVKGLLSVMGHPAARGERLVRADLAGTLRRWAKTGGEVFAEPRGAAAIEAATGGAVTAADLAGYRPVERAPLVGSFRGYTVVTMAPPSSGGVALLEALGVLDGYDLAALGHNSSDTLHLLAETFQHVYADRAHHLGDPAFVEVPVERLLSAGRRDEIRRAIWPLRTFPTESYGTRIAPPKDAGTQHISAVDADGGAVALTTTINNAFGSGVVVPGLGVVLNDEMDDFSVSPGTPNAYGLVGSEANAIAAGKRPLSSMTPTVVLDADGAVVMVVGASGGPTIISSTLQVLLDVLVFGLDAQEAVSAPRIHHQWLPAKLSVEPGIPDDVLRSLRARGHDVVVQEAYSAVQVIVRVGDGFEGGADPRKGGWPARP